MSLQVASSTDIITETLRYPSSPRTRNPKTDPSQPSHMGRLLIVNPRKLETRLRTNRAGIPYTLLLRIEAIRFPTFGLLLWLA